MADIAPLQAPVSHADEREHRRILALRGNATLPKNGGEPMTGPLKLKSVTVAGLANYPAADWTGAMLYCSDETGGAVPVFSNGTNWVRVTDLTTASAS